MHVVTIDNDFASWRAAARDLIIADVDPSLVEWRTIRASGRDTDGAASAMPFHRTAAENRTLFEDSAVDSETPTAGIANGHHDAKTPVSGASVGGVHPAARRRANGFSLPRDVLKQLRDAARNADPQRWAFLYQVLWRYARGDRSAVLPGDVDGARLTRLVRDVSREYHHWQAFLRFQESPGKDEQPVLMAWFDPEHDVLAPLADYFEKRLGRARWMIASPGGLARHDGDGVVFDLTAAIAPPRGADDTEALWRAYYRSIFNPARVNLDLTRQRLPTRFWKDLPEGDLIPTLASAATTGQQRHGQAGVLRGVSGKIIPVSADAAQPQRAVPDALDNCRRCPLWEHATQAVCGTGPTRAAMMLIGEQPGDQEDLAGKPFIGPAGQLLDVALENAGIQRDTLYLTNAVKHFKWTPRGKRRLHKTPAQHEVEACHIWLEKEIAAHQPRVVVTLGATALSSLIGNRATLAAVLNTPFRQNGFWVVPTYHPAYALRAPDTDSRDNAERTITAALAIAHALCEQDITDPGPSSD
jgi:DNA polymerase